MQADLNIGIIGAGFMRRAHADAFQRAGLLDRSLPARPRLYMVAERDEKIATTAAEALGFQNPPAIGGNWSMTRRSTSLTSPRPTVSL
jgi:predicted dehydrogenase